MLSEMLAAVHRRFPDHDIVGYFRATLPLHRLHVTAQVLEHQSLPLIPLFVLRAIRIGHRTPGALADVLGLDQSILSDAAGQLLHGDLIEERPVADGGPAKLVLRPAGEELLASKGALFVTARRDYAFQFNPVTAKLDPVDRHAVTTLPPEYEGDAMLPRKVFAPTAALLTVDMARTARGEEDRRRRDIIDLPDDEVRDVYPEYLPGVDVFLLRATDGGEAVAVFQRTHYLADVSGALTAMHLEDARVVPDDACLFDRDTGDAHALLPEAAAGLVADIIDRNRAIAVRERSLVVRRAFRGTTESQGEQGQVDAEIATAGAELRALRGERDRALEALRRAIGGPVRLVESGTYATQLREMIAVAKRDLLIIAPWISQSALGDATYKELGNAARRLDRLVIGYDGGRKRGGDQDRLEAQALQLKRRIREQSRWNPDKLAAGDNVPPSVRIENIPYAGPTVVICDDSRTLLAPVNPFVMNLATALPAPAAILFEDKATVRALAEGAERILAAGRGDRAVPIVSP